MPQPFYVSLASKLERAARALIILQGKSQDSTSFYENGDTFVANDSRTRTVLPNRTCVVPVVNPQFGHRPEGVLHLQIQHKFRAFIQPDENDWEVRRLEADNYLGATMDTMGIGDGNSDSSMPQLAAALTAAGQWLAKVDPNAAVGSPADKLAKNNADMVNFRVDWIRRAPGFLTRGFADEDSDIWVEILNFEVFVSYANIPN